jgi:hypothetical protein
MEENRKLRDILLDQCEAREIRIEELIKKTGIPEQYLDAIINDVRRRLPAFPYIRTYLVSIADLLELPRELVISKYRSEFTEKISGGGDMLPQNRFALPSDKKRVVIGAAVVGFVILLYAGSRSGFFGRPHLVIEMPPANQETFITSSSTIVLSGSVDTGDTLLLNGQAVTVDNNGHFSKEYQLAPEINILEFVTKRFLGRQLSITKQVYYEVATSTMAVKESKKKASNSQINKEAASAVETVLPVSSSPAEAPAP